MRQATVQPPARPNVYEFPIESEGSVRLRALSDQQGQSIRKLVELEAQRNGFAHQVTAHTGAEKERVTQLHKELIELTAEVSQSFFGLEPPKAEPATPAQLQSQTQTQTLS